MIKFVICEDSDEALETAGKYVIKAMMNYDIEYKVLKFKEYNNKFKKVFVFLIQILNSRLTRRVHLISP